MKEGQRQVEHIEDIGAERYTFCMFGRKFSQFQEHKHTATEYGQYQPLTAAPCRIAAYCIDRHHHKVTGSDQNQCVNGTAFPVQGLLESVEQLDVLCTGEGISQKKDAEHQQFGVDEYPDRKVTRQTAFFPYSRVTGDRFHQTVLATLSDAISRSPPLTKKEMTYRIRPARNTSPASSRNQ